MKQKKYKKCERAASYTSHNLGPILLKGIRMDIASNIVPVALGFRGWAFDKENPATQLKIVLSINGEQMETVRAKSPRKPLRNSGVHPSGKCGFQFRYNVENLKDGDVVNICEEESLKSLDGTPFTYTSKKVFFMHIAKTAGSALNSYVVNKIGKQNTRIHIEGAKKWLVSPDVGKDLLFVSGHVRIENITQRLDLSSFYKITLLREPFSHLLSHLAWVRRLCEVEEREKFEKCSPAIQKLALKLKDTDFSDPNQITNFIASLSPAGLNLFDNCQTRYFLSGHIKQPITESHLTTAQNTMKQFDLVGTNDQFNVFIQKLCRHTGWSYDAADVEKKNVHKKRFGLDSINEEQKAALRPLIAFDEQLYKIVTNNQKQ